MEMILAIIVIALLNPFQLHGHPTFSDEDDTHPTNDGSAMYKGPGVQGDMLFPDAPRGRALVKDLSTVRWTNGIIPYVFEAGFAFAQEAFIIETMYKMERLVAINNATCIRFRPKNATDIYFITFRNAPGCSSYVGQNTGLNFVRYVTLEFPGCIDTKVIYHELLHAIGFGHEQSRPDRDNYIRVNYTNIQAGMAHNFDKYNNTISNTFNISYEYNSVMQYSGSAFSVNGSPTMEALQPNVTLGGPNMTAMDIYAVRAFYNCTSSGTPLPSVTSPTLPNIYVINTTASSALNISDPKFARYYVLNRNYHYHIYTISVPVAGYYSIMSSSTINLYGYLYYPNFNANDSTDNLAAYDDNSAGSLQFQMIMNLAVNQNYTLVVTTSGQNTTGAYTIIVSGLNSVVLDRVNLNPATTTTTTVTTTTTATTVTTATTATTVTTTTATTTTTTSGNVTTVTTATTAGTAATAGTTTTAATEDNQQKVVVIVVVVVVTVVVVAIVFIALGLQICFHHKGRH